MYYIGFTYQDAYNLPIWKRAWFINRTLQEFKTAADNGQQTQSRAAHTNTPDQRAMSGLRPNAPARLRRFT
jgi:hypothetical protein